MSKYVKKTNPQKRGRKPGRVVRPERVFIRATPEERAEMEWLAKQDDRTLAYMVRATMHAAYVARRAAMDAAKESSNG